MSDSSAYVNLHLVDKAEAKSRAQLIRSVFSSYNHARLRRSYRFAPHQHREFELILIVRGRYECSINGHKYQLSKNSAVLIQPGDWHEDICPPKLEYIGIRFMLVDRDDQQNQVRFFRDNLPLKNRATSLAPHLYSLLLKRISKESKTQDTISDRMQDVLMEELFWILVRAFDSSTLASWLVPETPQERIRSRLYSCFQQNIHQPLSTPELAKMLRVSTRTLSLHCAELLHQSPARAFLQTKITRAQELLQDTEMTVKEVSYRLGFSNPYHFSRVYKDIIGHPPSHKRKEANGQGGQLPLQRSTIPARQ